MTQSFNLSQLANNVNTSGLLNAAAGLYNQVPVANGGTGVATLTSGAVVLGAGTSAVTTVAAGTTGNVLTSNGTAWVSQIASGGTPIVRLYTSPATWTKSPTLKAVKVTALGGGGGGGTGNSSGLPITYFNGGVGGTGGQGYYFAQSPAIAGPVTVTAGAGGAASVAGGASSFGGLFSVGGGGAGANAPSVANGAVGLPGFALSITNTPNTTTINALSGINYGVAGTNPGGAPSAGTVATGYGFGGGGGRGLGVGGAGVGGFVIVEEFY